MTGSLQEKNGKYYLVINLKDDLGKRHLKWINTNLDVKGNKKRAEQMLRDTLKEFEDQQMVYTKKTLFVDFLLEWLEMMRSAIKQNTWDSYQFVMVRHVIPFFMPLGVTLQDLQPVHLQRFYNSELADGRSPNTVIKYHTNIHKALDYALKLNLIPYNPSDRVQLPRKRKFIGSFYDEEQLQKLFVVAEGTPIESAVYLAAHYGLRRSEVLGLKWSAIDFKRDTIVVNHTVVIANHKVIAQDSAKTRSSYRTLPLTADIKSFLRRLQAAQGEQESLFGNTYVKNDYICKWDDGRPVTPDYVTRTFHKLLLDNSLPLIRFHDLRHSAASLLLNLGFSLKDIQEWLGHGDIGTTADIYAHLQYKAKIGMADKLSKALSAPIPANPLGKPLESHLE